MSTKKNNNAEPSKLNLISGKRVNVTAIQDNLAVINIGSSSGIDLNTKFKIIRIIGEGNESITVDIATAEVIKVLDERSAIRLIPIKGYDVKIGDIVIEERFK